MKISLIFLIVIILGLLWILLKFYHKIKKFYYRVLFKGYPKPWPIKEVSAADIYPFLNKKSLLDRELYLFNDDFGTSDIERCILSLWAKFSENIFEFGTYTGGTTYLLAKNNPEHGKIVTLTLHPDQVSQIGTTSKDNAEDIKTAVGESDNTTFMYEGTTIEHKITQLFCDSKQFNCSPYTEQFDLIFIDGAHAYSYVMSDTEKALQMLRPGGVVFWHDYRGPSRAKGVFLALNELAKKLPLLHIKGTALVFHQKPLAQ